MVPTHAQTCIPHTHTHTKETGVKCVRVSTVSHHHTQASSYSVLEGVGDICGWGGVEAWESWWLPVQIRFAKKVSVSWRLL